MEFNENIMEVSRYLSCYTSEQYIVSDSFVKIKLLIIILDKRVYGDNDSFKDSNICLFYVKSVNIYIFYNTITLLYRIALKDSYNMLNFTISRLLFKYKKNFKCFIKT